MIYSLSTLQTLFRSKFAKGEYIGDHVTKLGLLSTRLNAMRSFIDERMRVDILISVLSRLEEYAATLASVNTTVNYVATWNHSLFILLEKSKLQAHNEKINDRIGNSSDSELITSSFSGSQAVMKGRSSYIRCCNCNQTGHKSIQCPRCQSPTSQETLNVGQRRNH